MEQDPRVVLLLGDIGVHGFRDLKAKFPFRVLNVGICEQASVSLAAGLALSGMIPIYHTIAPFIVERALEQLKVDFGYQGLGGNFISVGASYDYSGLGCTHHCPGDVAILKTIPNMAICTPGHPIEFDEMFKRQYDSGHPTYFRLSEQSNELATDNVVKLGTKGRVIAIGPMLDRTKEACKDLDVSVFYVNYVLSAGWAHEQVVVAPFYEDSLPGFKGLSIGVPRKFLTNYGTVAEHDYACGLTAPQIRKRIMDYLNL